jgi:8-oxo-dGTP pyrophosphatase MutT (NUDIX family)
MGFSLKGVLLRLWRDVPIPRFVRRMLLRRLNPTFLIGAVAAIQDARGRLLLLKHTYRKQLPWGLPGGFLDPAEPPEQAVVREVFEETGLRVRPTALLAADMYLGDEVGLLYRCEVLSGEIVESIESEGHLWADLSALPPMPRHQRALLVKANLAPADDGKTP